MQWIVGAIACCEFRKRKIWKWKKGVQKMQCATISNAVQNEKYCCKRNNMTKKEKEENTHTLTVDIKHKTWNPKKNLHINYQPFIFYLLLATCHLALPTPCVCVCVAHTFVRQSRIANKSCHKAHTLSRCCTTYVFISRRKIKITNISFGVGSGGMVEISDFCYSIAYMKLLVL